MMGDDKTERNTLMEADDSPETVRVSQEDVKQYTTQTEEKREYTMKRKHVEQRGTEAKKK